MTKKTLFYAFSLLIKQLFSQLLNKAIVMALWTKVSLCVKSSLLEQSLPRTPSRPKTSDISVAKNLCNLWLKKPFNQRNPRLNISSCLRALRGEKIRVIRVNPWLINDLRLFKGLYNCKETFTDVMSALQIKLFMQNKAKFRKSQMNVSPVKEVVYEKRTLGERGKKQSQTKPNKPNFKKTKMNVNRVLTMDYENKPPIRAPKKQTQISKRQKPMQTSLPQRIMKKTALSGPGKTNPIQSQTKRCTNGAGNMDINNVLFHSDVVFRRHYLTQCKRHPC